MIPRRLGQMGLILALGPIQVACLYQGLLAGAQAGRWTPSKDLMPTLLDPGVVGTILAVFWLMEVATIILVLGFSSDRQGTRNKREYLSRFLSAWVWLSVWYAVGAAGSTFLMMLVVPYLLYPPLGYAGHVAVLVGGFFVVKRAIVRNRNTPINA